jgi:transglutaminase/protease-like cytokinesis protein 3
MKLIFHILLFILYAAIGKGQSRNFSEVDNYTKTLSLKYTHNVDTLAKRLTIKYENEIDKARSIFVWIANNISYDIYSFNKGNINSKIVEIEYVLQFKSTVCSGYANLFKRMCDIAGIKCLIISGYAKDKSYVPSIPLERIKHAWNIILVDNNLYIIDPTWGSGVVDNNNKYIKKINEKYFLADPEEFCKTHYPINSTFQLLERPILFQEFISNSIDKNKSLKKINFKDSINTIFNLSTYEYQLVTTIDFANLGLNDSNEIAKLYIAIAREKSIKAKSHEEIEIAQKSIDDALKYIRDNKVAKTNDYIKDLETYKMILDLK